MTTLQTFKRAPLITPHSIYCTRSIGHRDELCPRCLEILNGATAPKWYPKSRKATSYAMILDKAGV